MNICLYCLSEYHDSELHPGTCGNCGAPKSIGPQTIRKSYESAIQLERGILYTFRVKRGKTFQRYSSGELVKLTIKTSKNYLDVLSPVNMSFVACHRFYGNKFREQMRAERMNMTELEFDNWYDAMANIFTPEREDQEVGMLFSPSHSK